MTITLHEAFEDLVVDVPAHIVGPTLGPTTWRAGQRRRIRRRLGGAAWAIGVLVAVAVSLPPIVGEFRSLPPATGPAAPGPAPTSHPRDRGLEPVDWGWSKEGTPDPASTTLQVGAYFTACASGQAPKNPEAVVRYTDRYVYIGVWAEPLEDGAYTCPMGGSTPLTITLDEPIGTRKLIKDIPLYRHYEPGSWELAEPVDPTSRAAIVLVGERGCEGVSPGATVKYEIVPSPREVVLHVEVLPGPQHEWTCGGPDSAYRLTVDLGAPLGNRDLSHSEFEPAR